MTNLAALIETMEHSWMRAWTKGDVRTLKSLTTRDFLLLTASRPLTLLDRPSWLEAIAKRYRLHSYRFDQIYVSRQRDIAFFAAALDMETSFDGRTWSGQLLVADLWRKGRLRQGWKLAHRLLSDFDDRADLAAAMKSLQLWR